MFVLHIYYNKFINIFINLRRTYIKAFASGTFNILIRYNSKYTCGSKMSKKDPEVNLTQAEFQDLKKPKRKHPSFWKNLYYYFNQYCEYTSIHGLKYLGERKRSKIEKICWLIIFIASLYLCIDLILKTYDKWQSTPVIVSFARSPTPIYQVPFPAVTICSETKSRQTVYNFTDNYHKYINQNMTEEEMDQFSKISLLCDNHLLQEGNKTIGYDTIDFLSAVAPPFEEALWVCKWTNNNQSCDQLFTPILTEEGVCYTFNMLDREEVFTNDVFHNADYLSHGIKSKEWSLEKGYPTDAGLDIFPRRAISAGATAGLTMLLRAYDQDLDYICRGPVQGFKILLHQPGEIPRVSLQYFRAPLDQEVIVAIKPDMMTTSDSLRGYHPQRRQCYFAGERKLTFYKIYTQQNCEIECLANYTLDYCQCVAFHMPHNESTPICGSGNTLCMYEAFQKLLISQAASGIDTFHDRILKGVKNPKSCNCLPSCTTLTYNAETSQADFNWPRLFRAFKSNFSEFPGVRMARVTIFFKEMQFITSERNELYGSTDFLANCGGLLGLFMGFSFLSIVEIFYFLTVRVLCNLRVFGKHFWSGSEDILNDDSYIHDYKDKNK